MSSATLVTDAEVTVEQSRAPLRRRTPYREPPSDTVVAEAVLEARNLYKSFRKGRSITPVLRGMSVSLERGKLTAIVGQSGSGKSTLLHLLGTLDVPDAGEIRFDGDRIDNLRPRGRDVLRNRYFGMIFQFYHLLPELTALENTLAPAMIGHSVFGYWMNRRKLRRRAEELLELVGLSHRLSHTPRRLSGGEMQRTAIARALMLKPQVLLADEPTGNLDKAAGDEILRLLRTLNEQDGLTIVMVTHDPKIAAQTDRVVRLVDGKVEET